MITPPNYKVQEHNYCYSCKHCYQTMAYTACKKYDCDVHDFGICDAYKEAKQCEQCEGSGMVQISKEPGKSCPSCGGIGTIEEKEE